MNKAEFLSRLRSKLQGLPEKDIDDRISFYSEMIEDRIDDGKTEEAAVAEIGTVDEVVNEIAQDTPLVKLVKEKVTPKRSLRAWEIILLVLGFPLWFPLALTIIILAFIAYLLIWVLDIVVYSVEIALIAGSVWSLVLFFVYLFTGEFNAFFLGTTIMCAGGATLLVFGCIGITKATLKLSKKILTGIKAAFIKKGNKE